MVVINVNGRFKLKIAEFVLFYFEYKEIAGVNNTIPQGS
jgi:hypothetical protein